MRASLPFFWRCPGEWPQPDGPGATGLRKWEQPTSAKACSSYVATRESVLIVQQAEGSDRPPQSRAAQANNSLVATQALGLRGLRLLAARCNSWRTPFSTGFSFEAASPSTGSFSMSAPARLHACMSGRGRGRCCAPVTAAAFGLAACTCCPVPSLPLPLSGACTAPWVPRP